MPYSLSMLLPSVQKERPFSKMVYLSNQTIRNWGMRFALESISRLATGAVKRLRPESTAALPTNPHSYNSSTTG